MQHILLVGNGLAPEQFQGQHYNHIIALDGGIEHCRRLQLRVDHWLGDGDSSQPTEQFDLQPDQSTTDLGKGLQWIAQHLTEPYQVDLLAVTSSERLDHTLAAIEQLQRVPQLNWIITPSQRLRLIRDQYTLATTVGDRISLVSFGMGPATVDIEGCQWSGTALSLEAVSGISNRATATTVEVRVHSGMVIFIHG
jgi:thiamine pyrophosphokinase